MAIQTIVEHNTSYVTAPSWQLDDVMKLFEMPFCDLLAKAHQVHIENNQPNVVQISTLLNIKTGGCPENCKYCPQSAHYNTGLEKTPLMDIDEVVNAATKARQAGASRFCMGAAWRSLHDRDLETMTEMVTRVKALGLETCMTLGMINANQASCLKEAGLDYYNHNLDSSEEFYSEIISTRTYQERLDTLENIRQAGLKTCCGGIIGMGETQLDRAKLLLTLVNLPQPPESIPFNWLIRIPGTPLAEVTPPDPFDFVRAIAAARIMFPRSYVRVSAGREDMSDELQALCFFVGANSIFRGEILLTAKNPSMEQDDILLTRLGLMAS